MGARNYDDGVAQPFFEQPILNSPYEYPARHWELDENRQPTNHIVDRRRTVSFITPIPAARKQRAAQRELGVDDARGTADEDGQQYELMRMIESVRHSVNEWRRLPAPGGGLRRRPLACSIIGATTSSATSVHSSARSRRWRP